MPNDDKNILITLELETKGLVPADEALNQVATNDQKLVDAFTKTNAALTQRMKLVGQNDSALISYVNNLIKVQKATATGFGLKGLQELQNVTNDTTSAMELLQAAVDFAKKNINDFKPETPEFKQFNDTIERGEELLKMFADAQANLAKAPVPQPIVPATQTVEQEITPATLPPITAEPVVVPVEVNKADVDNIPAEINAELPKEIQLTANITIPPVNTEAITEAVGLIKDQLSAGAINVEGLQNILEVSKQLIETVPRESEDFKELALSIISTTEVLKEFGVNVPPINIPVGVNENDVKNIPAEIESGLTDIPPVNVPITISKEEVTKAISSITNELSNNTVNVDVLKSVTQDAQKLLPLLNQETEEYKNLNSVIEQSTAVLKQLDVSNKAVVTGETSIRTQIRQTREELAQRLATGELSVAEIYDEAKAAGVLKDAYDDANSAINVLSSDTFAFDSIASGVQAATAGMQVFAGISALAGANNEDLQKTLVKLNAVMSISAGIQQAINLLQKNNVLQLGLQVAGQKILSVSTSVTTGILEAFGVVVAEDTVLFKGLNAVIIGSGIGLLITALVILLPKLADFVTGTEQAKDIQDKFNQSLKDAGEYLDAYVDGVENAGDKVVAKLKANNASTAEISRQELANIKIVNQARQSSLDELTDQLNDETYVRKLTADQYKELSDKQLELQSQVTKGQTLVIQKQADIEVSSFQARLKSTQSFADAQVTIASEQTSNLKKIYDANISAATTSANVQLQNANLQAGERYLIEVNLQKKIQDLTVTYKTDVLKQQKNIADSEVTLATEGSKQQLTARLKDIQIQHDIDITQARDDSSQKEKIDAEYFINKKKLLDDYNLKVAQDTVNTGIAYTNDNILKAQLDGQKDNDDAIIELKKNLIDQQADLEVLSIQTTVKNEELRRTLIKGIYDKALVDKKALEDAKNKAEIDAALKSKQNVLDLQAQSLQAQQDVVGAFGPARKKLDDAITANALSNIQAQKDALAEQFAKGIIGFNDFYNQVNDLDNQSAQIRIQNAEAVANRTLALQTAAVDVISSAFNQITDNQKSSLEQQATDNQTLLDQKVITQNEFNKRQEQIKKQEAAINKEQAIFEIFTDAAKSLFKIEAAAAVANAILPGSGAFALAQIPFLLAQEAIALALVAARKFKQGKIKIDGPGTETSDSILAGISKNESVISAKATTGTTTITNNDKNTDVRIKHVEILEAINNNQLNKYFNEKIFSEKSEINHIKIYSTKLIENEEVFKSGIQHFLYDTISANTALYDSPEMKTITQEDFELFINNVGNIDYDKIGKSVAEHVGKLEDIPSWGIDFNERGAQLWRKKMDEKTTYLNKKFGYKPWQ